MKIFINIKINFNKYLLKVNFPLLMNNLGVVFNSKISNKANNKVSKIENNSGKKAILNIIVMQ